MALMGVSVEKSFKKLINMLYQESFIVFNLDPLVKLSVREFTQIGRKNFCFFADKSEFTLFIRIE